MSLVSLCQLFSVFIRSTSKSSLPGGRRPQLKILTQGIQELLTRYGALCPLVAGLKKAKILMN